MSSPPQSPPPSSIGRPSPFLVRQPLLRSSRSVSGCAHYALQQLQRQRRPPTIPSRLSLLSTSAGVAEPREILNQGAVVDHSSDASRLPLDLLETTTASTGAVGRGARQRRPSWAAHRAGVESDAVDAGLFVCPNTIVAALHSAVSGIVVTAECGGWLRLRDGRRGTIQHQRQLPSGNEATCLCWTSVMDRVGLDDCRSPPPPPVVVVGLMSGVITLYLLVGASLVECFASSGTTCTGVWHSDPVLSLLSLNSSRKESNAASNDSTSNSSTGGDVIVSMDAGGAVAVWCVRCDSLGTVQHPSDSFGLHLHASTEAVNEAATGNATPPVLITAEPAYPCGLFCSKRLENCGASTTHTATTTSGGDEAAIDSNVAQPTTSTEMSGPAASPKTAVYLIKCPVTVVQGGGQWIVVQRYSISAAVAGKGSGEPDIITALCCVDRGSASMSQLWAGLSDGRLFAWQLQTGVLLRQVAGVSSSPPHCLVSIGASLAATSPLLGGPTAAAASATVWVCSADGSVTSYRSDSFAMSEVLPVGYPPMAATRHGDTGATVVVRDAVDLLRTTRHLPFAQQSVISSRGPSGFTLFLAPLDVMLVQRVWSAATDGTVRSWLLPAGMAARNGGGGGGGGVDPDGATVLDPHTVQHFMNELAQEAVQERHAMQSQMEMFKAQIASLEQRNSALSTALQQALDRLEKVGAAGAADSSLQSENGTIHAAKHSLAGAPSECAVAADDTPGLELGVVVQCQDELLPPCATVEADRALTNAYTKHIAALQELVSLLQAKLEGSWTRNDELMEELLRYQLQALERDSGDEPSQSCLVMAETRGIKVVSTTAAPLGVEARASPLPPNDGAPLKRRGPPPDELISVDAALTSKVPLSSVPIPNPDLTLQGLRGQYSEAVSPVFGAATEARNDDNHGTAHRQPASTVSHQSEEEEEEEEVSLVGAWCSTGGENCASRNETVELFLAGLTPQRVAEEGRQASAVVSPSLLLSERECPAEADDARRVGLAEQRTDGFETRDTMPLPTEVAAMGSEADMGSPQPLRRIAPLQCSVYEEPHLTAATALPSSTPPAALSPPPSRPTFHSAIIYASPTPHSP